MSLSIDFDLLLESFNWFTIRPIMTCFDYIAGNVILLSPYSTKKWDPTQRKSTIKEMYMASARILRWGPNTTYIPPVRVGGNTNFSFCIGGNAKLWYFHIRISLKCNMFTQ